MIEVKGLTKYYADHLAVDGVSFRVEPGEILGFLGPNGAGKTTTMRMLTGFLSPTEGEITVAGVNVLEDAERARRSIGYLPEGAPLYHEMRVRSYLNFRAKLKGLGYRQRRLRVDEVLKQCWIEDVQNRIIGHLSKGFRQRVSLADALVADPPVLILDEPTVGMDPNQIRAVRELIRSLAGKHTIILSTHILPEVEMVCARAIIINKRIVAGDTLANLKRTLGVIAEIRGDRTQIESGLKAVAGVSQVTVTLEGEFHQCRVETKEGQDLRQTIAEFVAQKGWTLRELSLWKSSLEEIFIKTVGGES